MKVLVALDDSPFTEHALDLICHRNWEDNTEFKLVYVSRSLGDENWAGEKWAGMQHELSNKRRSFAETLVGNARKKLREQIPHSLTHFEVREGDFKTEILESVAMWHPSIIMLPAQNGDLHARQRLDELAADIEKQTDCIVEILKLELSESRKGS